MVNLRLGSLAPDFEAETSTGDIKVSVDVSSEIVSAIVVADDAVPA
jgi:hypothetical protein